MTKKPTTIQQFFKKFPDDETCLKHLFLQRFGKVYDCPKCERKAKWYPIKAERAYSCQFCGHHIHPTVGTIFESSSTSLQLWFYAIYLFTTTRNGVSAKELQRQLGVTYKCAWRIGHKIREHMAEVDGEDPLSGIVEVDETYVGGKGEGVESRGRKHKTIVMGMAEKDGDVMTKVIPNVQKKTLHPHIEENIEKGSEIQTDELNSYKGLDKKGYTHETVNHAAGEYVSSTGATTNTIEGFWNQLKNGIRSTHIHVSSKHLAKYAKEFEYRFNSRSCPERMLEELLTFEK
jgi:transposase-like protein/DNA-directed RNA polymerase subunit RPC12/RpoP